MTTAALLFGVMAILAKGAAARIPGPEIAFFRFVTGLVACGVAATRIRMRAHNWRGLALRGLFGGSAVLCYFLAIQHLAVGMATLLNYTAPVFTALWAWMFLGERIRLGTLGALVVTTVGVAVVIVADAPPGRVALGPWQLVGIGSAMLSGAAVATIRQVRKTDGSWEIFAAFCIAGAAICAGPALQGWVSPRPLEWKVLILVGVLSVVGQLLMTHALRYVRAAVGGIIAQLTPVTSMLLGWMMFRDRIVGLALAGAALTLAGVSVGAYLASGAEADPVDE
jgi:drug/metabolite transporter (DMT)-like permease